MKATILILIAFLLFSCDYQAPKVYESEQVNIHVYNELGDELNATVSFITIEGFYNKYENTSLVTPFTLTIDTIDKHIVSISCIGYKTVTTYFSVNQRTFILETL